MTEPAYRLYAVRYAQRDAVRGEHFYGHDPRAGDPMPMAYYVWVAVSPETTVVIDTGFTADTARRRGRTYLDRPAATLARLGVDPEAVPLVVLTHLHYDHSGTTGDFPAARFVLQEREMAFWTGRHASRGEHRHLAEAGDVAGLCLANFDGRVAWVDGDGEVAPGITVHRVGGHTPGMQVVGVRTEAGRGVVASDASHFYANIDEDRPFSVVHHLPDMYRAFDTIRALADHPSLIVAGHDPLVMDRYPAASDDLADRAVRIA